MTARPLSMLIVLALPLLGAATTAYRAGHACPSTQQPIVPVGLFIGAIEEGARIFTPVRLLPKEHPDAEGHEFPNALQLHHNEYEALVWLGEHIGLRLAATLQRYPRPPVQQWWYPEFEALPLQAIRAAPVHRMPGKASPIPGLKAAVFYQGQAICFIVDTRGLTLEERGMERATTTGLDMTRAAFLAGLQEVAGSFRADSVSVVVLEE